jgi:hypothetical protein
MSRRIIPRFQEAPSLEQFQHLTATSAGGAVVYDLTAG